MLLLCVATLLSFIWQQMWFLNIYYKIFSPCKLNVGESIDNTVCVEVH